MRRSALFAAATVAGAALIGTAASGDRRSGKQEYRPSARTRRSPRCASTTSRSRVSPRTTAAVSTRPRARAGHARWCGTVTPRPSARSRRRVARPASRSTATASCSSPTATTARSTACGRAARTRPPRPSSPPGSLEPTASRSTGAATSGCPTAARARAACGGSAMTAPRARSSASSRWSTTSTRSTRFLQRHPHRRRGPRSALGAPGDRGDHAHRPLRRQHAGSQHIVANGLAFDRDGSLFVGDTARGAIWRVDLDRRGNVRSPTGCDTTFTANTLCLDNVFVQHPTLEGVDGIALDRQGNVVSAVNERNAVVVATARDGVVELFRNPVSARAAAQRRAARVPDQPGARRPHAVPHAFGRLPPRQLPQFRRGGRPGQARAREDLLPRRRSCRSRGSRSRSARHAVGRSSRHGLGDRLTASEPSRSEGPFPLP